MKSLSTPIGPSACPSAWPRHWACWTALLLAGCGHLATDTPTGLPARTPVQTLIGSPATEAALAARPSIAPPSSVAAPAPAPARASAPPAPSEPRFDLVVNNAAARDVYLALAGDGRYNVLTHPELAGSISVTLRRVTLREALDALRDVYGYDYRIDGRRITVYPATMQSRVFVVNYLHSQRSGRSDVRVSSGSAPTNGSSGNSTGGNSSTSGSGTAPPDSSQVSTESRNDLWAELGQALRSMIGTANGRSVILSPQSGMIAVRAMPDELRQVEALLNAARMAVERQVMLDVKIVQVELREGYQSGIDWSVLRSRGAIGSVGGSSTNPIVSNANGLPTLAAATSAAITDALSLPSASNGLFGLSLAANSFQMVLGFLESHGDVQTLSSPRLATLNNQKAVLKVGTDDYFVTNVSGGTVNTGSSSSTNQTTMPSLTLTPFFSGIALDVTPQIDDGHMITLHVHPSVSAVNERNKQVDLGALGSYKLPLASSSINETDTVVRIPDGQIVAIGGLMQSESTRTSSGLPGSGDNSVTATLMGNRLNSGRKKELVVLIKPSIIRSGEDWQEHTRSALAQLQGQDEPVPTIRVEGRAPAPSLPMAPAAQPGLQLAVEAEPMPPAAEPPATAARKVRKAKSAKSAKAADATAP